MQVSVQQPLYTQDMQSGAYGAVRQIAEYDLKSVNADFGQAHEEEAKFLRRAVFTKRKDDKPSSTEIHYKNQLAESINRIAGGKEVMSPHVRDIVKDVYVSSFELGFKSINNPGYITTERQDAYQDRMNMLYHDLGKFFSNAAVIENVAQAGVERGVIFAEKYGL